MNQPKCPECKENAYAETLAIQRRAFPEEKKAVDIIYCNNCGHIFTVVPVSS